MQITMGRGKRVSVGKVSAVSNSLKANVSAELPRQAQFITHIYGC